MSLSTNLILGGPGAGKTTRLLEVVEEALAGGVPPDRIAFVSFTRAAVAEAAARAMTKFKIKDRDDLPYFRTLHSMCYRQLGLSRSEVFNRRHLSAVGELLGIRLTGAVSVDDDADDMGEGDRMLFVEEMARGSMRDLKDAWSTANVQVSWHRLEQFAGVMQAYKDDLVLVDFTDMLSLFLEECEPLPVDVFIVDEGQDLTPLQWAVVDHASKDAIRMYVAGDDDQAIYQWSGADVARFLTFDADEREVLPASHRLPRAVFDFSNEIVSRIGQRYDKEWAPRSEGGEVHHHRAVGHVDFATDGSWLVLARNRRLLPDLAEEIATQGLSYRTRSGPSVDPAHVRAILSYEKLRSGGHVDENELAELAAVMSPEIDVGKGSPIWHDALTGILLSRREYYLTILRRGGRLQDPPQIIIDTIHSAKGMEADDVLLCSDMMKRPHEAMIRGDDGEHRVFYVGATRARNRLHILLPQTHRHYLL